MSADLPAEARVIDIDDVDFDMIEANTAHMLWWENLSHVERCERPYDAAHEAFIAGWTAKAARA